MIRHLGSKNILLILAFTLLAATPCGTAPPIGGWTYGISGGALKPGISIRRVGPTLAVNEALGDRMFTSILSYYDVTTLNLLSSKRSANCCGTYWTSVIQKHQNNTYTVHAHTDGVGPGGKPSIIDSRLDFTISSSQRVAVGTLLIVPWIYHKAHVNSIATIDFDPLRERILTIRELRDFQTPDGVPARDHALRLTSAGQSGLTLWYDPCSYVVDAFAPADYTFVRTGLNVP